MPAGRVADATSSSNESACPELKSWAWMPMICAAGRRSYRPISDGPL
jgi:hypothetical protein